MAKKLGLLVAMIAVGVLLAGCAASAGGASSTPVSIVGQWGSSAAGQPNLTFTDSGRVSGTDGCNRISTKYALAGATITFDPFMSTMMACPGVDAWLSKVHTMTVSGNSLLVKNAAGDQIGTLKKAG